MPDDLIIAVAAILEAYANGEITSENAMTAVLRMYEQFTTAHTETIL